MTEDKLIHLKNTSSIELSKLVEGNVTYSVLHRILKKNCTDIFHNSESVIICYSNPPYPIWVWCKDANDACDIANIAECIKKCYPLEEDYNIEIEAASDKGLLLLSNIGNSRKDFEYLRCFDGYKR